MQPAEKRYDERSDVGLTEKISFMSVSSRMLRPLD